MNKLKRIVFTVTLASIFILGSVLPATAAETPFFPTQNIGNRGVDVLAIQLLLRHRGATIAADGAFGPKTKSAVESFQRSRGIAADGSVGPVTWSRLIVTVRRGSRGPAVRAVQILLKEKFDSGLGVDGDFGPLTEDAVKRFQGHMGILADGIVGRNTWKRLLWHYGQPNTSQRLCGYRDAGRRWGTGATIGQLEAAASTFFATGNGPVAVGDISLVHGGPIDGHASHEVGLDVDIRLPRTDNDQCNRPCNRFQSCYDQAATRALVLAIRARARGHVKYVFFNDPALIREGLTTYEDLHDDHLHVRYCEDYHPNPRYNC
jgi:hypothetical protein